MQSLSAEQVLALAPDGASAKAAQGLVKPAKWSNLGRSERSVWGECQGSGANPYRAQADLSGPAFHCTCPSRKFPCKHGLALLLIAAARPGDVKDAPLPAWVEEWIAKRDANADKKAARAAAEAAPANPETEARRQAEREKRAAKREDRVREGLASLEIWLHDLMKQGLAYAKQSDSHMFDAMAARMVDAQAPGIARRLRKFPSLLAGEGSDWAGRALEEAGMLQCLLSGYSRMDTLPEGLRASVRNAIGWTVSEQELAGAETVRDRWQVVGQTVEEEEMLRVQRTWLVSETTRRPALCLGFAAGNQTLDVGLVPGTSVEAELAFYPSAAPLRAVVRQRFGAPSSITNPAAYASYEEALELSASLFSGDPWLERTPWLVRDCVPLRVDETWMMRDATNRAVPLFAAQEKMLQLFAISAGHPVTIFGEWSGVALQPLSVFSAQRFVCIGGRPE